MIIATFWNRIAKKIDMGDNLEGHEGFFNRNGMFDPVI